MSLEDTRNCGCGMDTMENNSYVRPTQAMMMNKNNCNCECVCQPETGVDCELKAELLEQIRCLDFAINELALYLDTHPEDEKALCLHRKYSKEVKELKDKYQRMFGPLTIFFPCNKWRWLEEPWPWERGDF